MIKIGYKMLNLLSQREMGLLDGLCLRRCEMRRRAQAINISEDKNMEQLFSSGVNSIDMERQDNRYLIAGSSESKFAIYDTAFIEEGEKNICKSIAVVDRSSEEAHKYSIETVQWYPRDNGMFITSSFDSSVKVWDSNTLQVADEINLAHRIYCHHLSSIARKHCLLAVACDASKIILCDLKTGSSTHSLRGHKKSVLAVAWSPRSEYILASGSQDNRVLIWDVRKASSCMMSMDQHNGEAASSMNTNITAHNGFINGLSFTSDGLHLLSYGTDDRLRLWDIWNSENTLVNYGSIYNVSKKHVQMAVTSELLQDLVFVPTEKSIAVFEIFTGRKVNMLNGHYGGVNCCYYEKHFQELYSGGMDTHVLSWSPPSCVSSHFSKRDKMEESEAKAGEAYQDAWSSDDDDDDDD